MGLNEFILAVSIIIYFIFVITIITLCFRTVRRHQHDISRLENERQTQRQNVIERREHLQSLNLFGSERRQAAIDFLSSRSETIFPQETTRSAPNLLEPYHISSSEGDERKRFIERFLCTTKVNDEQEVSNLALALKISPQQDEEGISRSNNFDNMWNYAVNSLRSNISTGNDSNRSSPQLECTICLETYEKGEKIAWAKSDKCNHIFHEECIHMWLKENDDCPLCRFQILVGNDNHV